MMGKGKHVPIALNYCPHVVAFRPLKTATKASFFELPRRATDVKLVTGSRSTMITTNRCELFFFEIFVIAKLVLPSSSECNTV